jgi:hypothetical protein
LLDDEQWRARAAQKGCAAAAATAIIQTTSRGCDDLNSHTHTHTLPARERESERAGESRRGGLVGWFVGLRSLPAVIDTRATAKGAKLVPMVQANNRHLALSKVHRA